MAVPLVPARRASFAAVAWFLFYLAVLTALLVIYGHGDFSPPTFIYQGF